MKTTLSAVGLMKSAKYKALPTAKGKRVAFEHAGGVWRPFFYRSGRLSHYEFFDGERLRPVHGQNLNGN